MTFLHVSEGRHESKEFDRTKVGQAELYFTVETRIGISRSINLYEQLDSV
jgi:hypothetical protein